MQHKGLIRFFHENGKNASEIYDILKKRYPSTCPCYSSITYHIRMNRLQWKEDPRKKIRKKQPNYLVLNKIRKLIQREPWHTARSIEKETGIPKSTVHYHLTHFLGYRSVRTKYIPHVLTNDQKKKRVELSKQLLFMLRAEKKRNYMFIVTGDESWFYYKTFPRHKWIKEGEAPPTRPREKFDTKKLLITIFWSVHGIEYISALKDGDSYNSKYFCANVLDSLLNSPLYDKAKNQKMRYVLHMDNSPVHNSKYTHFYIKDSGLSRADHPPYSPDLAPSDFWLFGTLDNMKREHTFESPEESVEWIEEKFSEFSVDDIKSVFENWEARLERCIELKGDYVQ